MTERPSQVLEVRELRKTFKRKGQTDFLAVDGVSFQLESGQCLGLVGESGSGKSTTANIILRFIEPSSGTIVLEGRDITRLKGRELRQIYHEVQAVFQNPAQSFDPRKTLGKGIAETIVNFGMSRQEAAARTRRLLERCGLPADISGKYPREVSGGQCQRAAIARALAPNPSLLICDEATSALDVTVQKQIVELIVEVRHETNMAVLFICHDIALVSEICDDVIVMKDGRIVEKGHVNQVMRDPQSDYTRTLIDAVL